MTLADEANDLQEQAMTMLLTIRKQVADIEHATERARVVSTLYVRAARLAELFGARAQEFQSKATRRSIGLHVSRLKLADLAGRLTHLQRAAGRGCPIQARRAAKDLAETKRLIDQWGTDPMAAQETTP